MGANPSPNPNQDVGWCVGVIQKCNGDKRKTVDGYMANFEVWLGLG